MTEEQRKQLEEMSHELLFTSEGEEFRKHNSYDFMAGAPSRLGYV